MDGLPTSNSHTEAALASRERNKEDRLMMIHVTGARGEPRGELLYMYMYMY